MHCLHNLFKSHLFRLTWLILVSAAHMQPQFLDALEHGKNHLVIDFSPLIVYHLTSTIPIATSMKGV